MIIQWKVTIPELTGRQERSVYVYLPNSYESYPEKRYPVLYMFDGHNIFFNSHATYGKCWGMKEYMESTDTQMIIAAVECNHSPDNGRLSEYSPYDLSTPEFGEVEGKGEITMNWMVHTFKEDIDRNFRTLPDREHTFIAGSSMGGLMSLYAVLQYNQYYSRAAALSPSVWLARKEMKQLIKNAELLPDTHVYMDYGEYELGNHKGMLKCFSRVCALLMNRSVLFTGRIIPGGTHCEASWEKQIPFFMAALNAKADAKKE